MRTSGYKRAHDGVAVLRQSDREYRLKYDSARTSRDGDAPRDHGAHNTDAPRA